MVITTYELQLSLTVIASLKGDAIQSFLVTGLLGAMQPSQ